MNAPPAQWRTPVCMLFLFLLAAFVSQAYEGVKFANTFMAVRSSWLPAQGLVLENLIASSERRSASTRVGAVAHINLYTAGARVSYSIDNGIYHGPAMGWEEALKPLSNWEASGLIAGHTIPIRLDPQDLGHATLLGEWNRVSVTVFARYLATLVALLCGLMTCAKFAIKREL
jgi:hypothetical protein